MTPLVCEYNNWWQIKWDLLRAEADLLEAQAAESGVKKRRGWAMSQTALRGEEEEQKRLPESTGLRTGDARAADNQEGESREPPPPPPGLEPWEQQAPLPPPRETTGYTTARGEE